MIGRFPAAHQRVRHQGERERKRTLVEQVSDAHVDVVDPFALLGGRGGVHQKRLGGCSNVPAVFGI